MWSYFIRFDIPLIIKVIVICLCAYVTHTIITTYVGMYYFIHFTFTSLEFNC